MSVESWKAEHYPVPADTEMTDVEAIEHSLVKWKGLRPEVLKKHGLIKCAIRVGEPSENGISRDESILTGGSSCALCVKCAYQCYRCPIVKVTGNSCDGNSRPYRDWLNTDDPEPMIALLERTLEGVKK